MSRWRGRISVLSLATILLFTASIAVPRTGLVFHVHAGGEHLHVHDDFPIVSDHAHASHLHHHTHTDHLGARNSEVPELEAPDGDDAGHWHVQSPFHRAASVTQITVLPPRPAGLFVAAPRLNAVRRAIPRRRARSPPPLTSRS
jgi:hypothetical protein